MAPHVTSKIIISVTSVSLKLTSDKHNCFIPSVFLHYYHEPQNEVTSPSFHVDADLLMISNIYY